MENLSRTFLVKSPISVVKDKFDFRCMSFTAIKEKYEEKVSFYILHDDTSELVFRKDIFEESCFWGMDDEVVTALYEYVEENITEMDKLFTQLKRFGI